MGLKSRHITVIAISAVVIVLWVIGWLLLRGADMPVLWPTGEIAYKQRDLLLFTLGLSVVVVVPVFVMLAMFAYKYRASNTAAEYKPKWGSNTLLEAIWWGIPIIIIVILSVVTFISSHELDPYRKISSDKKPIEVKVLALQWKWMFFYPGEQLATVNELVIPENTPITFKLSADAPMSAFWIPTLGSQIYNMNGMTSQLNLIGNKKGEYTGYTTNINGKGYADMTFKVRVVSEEDFHRWHHHILATSPEITQKIYDEYAKPNIVKEPKYFTMKQDTIYDSVVAKYMSMPHDMDALPSGEIAVPSTTSQSKDTANTMHNGHGGH